MGGVSRDQGLPRKPILAEVGRIATHAGVSECAACSAMSRTDHSEPDRNDRHVGGASDELCSSPGHVVGCRPGFAEEDVRRGEAQPTRRSAPLRGCCTVTVSVAPMGEQLAGGAGPRSFWGDPQPVEPRRRGGRRCGRRRARLDRRRQAEHHHEQEEHEGLHEPETDGHVQAVSIRSGYDTESGKTTRPLAGPYPVDRPAVHDSRCRGAVTVARALTWRRRGEPSRPRRRAVPPGPGDGGSGRGKLSPDASEPPPVQASDFRISSPTDHHHTAWSSARGSADAPAAGIALFMSAAQPSH
jgi:hypothetical protein